MNEIKNLIEIRSKLVENLKVNDFFLDNILAGLYNDPSHFVYEILQNAEDAFATKITFKLFQEYLEISHDGKDFTFDDVNGITGIGISSKKNDINSIGKFGVGFKSVFAITETPEIHSGKFNFKITDFVIPKQLDAKANEGTSILLPFNHPIRNKEEVFGIVGKKLEGIGLKTLLFLKNLREIRWQIDDKYGHYLKEEKEYSSFDNVHRIAIVSKAGEEEFCEEYLVFRKPISIEGNNLKVELAYRIVENDENEINIIKETDSKLIVYFPTEKVTYLNFLIQAPYKTTPNRENIPLNDKQNQYLIKETSNLVAESISIIKQLGLLNVSFLEVLPIEQNHNEEYIYSSIFEEVKKKFLSEEPLLPTSEKSFTTPQNAVLARGKELTELLRGNDLEVLFNKKNWLDNNITNDRTKLLREYLLNELVISEISFEDFAKSITCEFLDLKSDEWMIDFYVKLLKQRSLWIYDAYDEGRSGILRKKPIIRLSDNSHINPCDDDGKIQVYLPTREVSKYKTVKNALLQNKMTEDFLKELGLREPDIFSEIKEFILPKYSKYPVGLDFNEYLEDFNKLLLAFNIKNSEKEDEIIHELKNLHIIHGFHPSNGKSQFYQPSEVYVKTEELIEYFKGFDDVIWISNELTDFFKEVDGFEDFLVAIGCETKPRRISVVSNMTNSEKKAIINVKGNFDDWGATEYEYDGLDNFLTEIDKERSKLLWNFLIESVSTYTNYWGNKSEFFKGEFIYFYRKRNSVSIDSKFLKTLKNVKWLWGEDNIRYCPIELTLEELAKDYDKENENVKYLEEALNFQLDQIKKIEQKTQGKFLTKEEYKEYEKYLGDQSLQRITEEPETWVSQIEPEKCSPTIEVRVKPGVVSPNPRPSGGIEEPDSQDETQKKKPPISSGKKKAIGAWGEKLVYEHLIKKYLNAVDIKVIWMNEKKECGIGYDIVLEKNGVKETYIEVKSKIDDNEELILISGTQWEFARELYQNCNGDAYEVHVVSNAGSPNAKISIISNPINLWNKGELYAHPIAFKL